MQNQKKCTNFSNLTLNISGSRRATAMHFTILDDCNRHRPVQVFSPGGGVNFNNVRGGGPGAKPPEKFLATPPGFPGGG